jgi:thioredoxin 1
MNRSNYWILVLLLLVFGCVQKQPASANASSSPIYDEKADAHRDITAAIANAEGSKRNIVLIFGANW